ncbi:MAG: Por secretion system protein, partial [Bacteroidales bacterium]|nr:Por secretion system protein [Bacteroidales bacterium]
FDNPNGRYSSVECKNIMVPSGDYIIELLHNEAVRMMVCDGANRKWIGTESNGLFLVSADGTQEVAHFTAENSDLLSDQISAVGMIPYTGEVFMATGGGICSYMGTGAFMEEGAKALPFPNPVPPGYDGYISIRNLPADAEVKITDAAGHLIYEGRATGSQLSWDGFNMQGKRPQSGVLLVFAATSDGSQRIVCKIFYAR